MAKRLTPADLHRDLRRFRFLSQLPIRRPLMLRLAQAITSIRLRPRVGAGMGYGYVDLGNGAGAHVYQPRTSNGGALMWIHGGGMVIGSGTQDHGRCIRVARELDITVVSVEYRLAPQHPFPAPLDDCERVWNWMLDNAERLGIDPQRIAIGGQSAGGGLAAGLALRLHDRGGTQPVAQWLFCPMLDDRTAANRSLDDIRHYVWDNRNNLVGWSAYLAGAPGSDGVSPYASPARRTDLADLPPAWIGVGDIDLFFDEDRRYAEALGAAGVPCEFDVVPGGPHAFETLARTTQVSRVYLDRASGWLGEQLALR